MNATQLAATMRESAHRAGHQHVHDQITRLGLDQYPNVRISASASWLEGDDRVRGDES